MTQEILGLSLYAQIVAIIQEARVHIRTAVNTTMVMSYWGIGRLIVEDEQQGERRAEYGKAVLEALSQGLTADFGSGFNVRNLRYMRQFYQAFPIRNAVRSELTWTHYRLLLKLQDEQARQWYLKEAVSANWSTRALERQINSLYYERLLSSGDKHPVQEEAEAHTHALAPRDVLKDPYVLEFLQLGERPGFTETELESALIHHLQSFLLELGRGFSFVARQQRITLDDEHFYIDLVFYNYRLKCFVLIDLKLGKLTHQDIGQMDTYMRLYEEQHRAADDNPTLGLILCSEKNEAVARYSFLAEGKHLFASKYQLLLPSEEELATELRREIKEIEGGVNRAEKGQDVNGALLDGEGD